MLLRRLGLDEEYCSDAAKDCKQLLRIGVSNLHWPTVGIDADDPARAEGFQTHMDVTCLDSERASELYSASRRTHSFLTLMAHGAVQHEGVRAGYAKAPLEPTDEDNEKKQTVDNSVSREHAPSSPGREGADDDVVNSEEPVGTCNDNPSARADQIITPAPARRVLEIWRGISAMVDGTEGLHGYSHEGLDQARHVALSSRHMDAFSRPSELFEKEHTTMRRGMEVVFGPGSTESALAEERAREMSVARVNIMAKAYAEIAGHQERLNALHNAGAYFRDVSSRADGAIVESEAYQIWLVLWSAERRIEREYHTILKKQAFRKSPIHVGSSVDIKLMTSVFWDTTPCEAKKFIAMCASAHSHLERSCQDVKRRAVQKSAFAPSSQESTSNSLRVCPSATVDLDIFFAGPCVVNLPAYGLDLGAYETAVNDLTALVWECSHSDGISLNIERAVRWVKHRVPKYDNGIGDGGKDNGLCGMLYTAQRYARCAALTLHVYFKLSKQEHDEERVGYALHFARNLYRIMLRVMVTAQTKLLSFVILVYRDMLRAPTAHLFKLLADNPSRVSPYADVVAELRRVVDLDTIPVTTEEVFGNRKVHVVDKTIFSKRFHASVSKGARLQAWVLRRIQDEGDGNTCTPALYDLVRDMGCGINDRQHLVKQWSRNVVVLRSVLSTTLRIVGGQCNFASGATLALRSKTFVDERNACGDNAVKWDAVLESQRERIWSLLKHDVEMIRPLAQAGNFFIAAEMVEGSAKLWDVQELQDAQARLESLEVQKDAEFLEANPAKPASCACSSAAVTAGLCQRQWPCPLSDDDLQFVVSCHELRVPAKAASESEHRAGDRAVPVGTSAAQTKTPDVGSDMPESGDGEIVALMSDDWKSVQISHAFADPLCGPKLATHPVPGASKAAMSSYAASNESSSRKRLSVADSIAVPRDSLSSDTQDVLPVAKRRRRNSALEPPVGRSMDVDTDESVQNGSGLSLWSP